MNAEIQIKKEECLTAACLLSIAGGWMDVYSYLFRGHVFANAVTGNIVLFGVYLSSGKWSDCGKYLFAIAAYGGGVLLANYIQEKKIGIQVLGWQQFVLLVESVLLVPIAFIPMGPSDTWINGIISFVCAMQVQTFRNVHGLPFASTMCTGNLRSGTDALFHGIRNWDFQELKKAMHYFLIIAFFVTGAVAGSFLLTEFSEKLILCAPVILSSVILILRLPQHTHCNTKVMKSRSVNSQKR